MICHEKWAIKCILAMNCIDIGQPLHWFSIGRDAHRRRWSTRLFQRDKMRSRLIVKLTNKDHLRTLMWFPFKIVLIEFSIIDALFMTACSSRSSRIMQHCILISKKTTGVIKRTLQISLSFSLFSFAFILFEKVIFLFIFRHSFCPRQSTSLQWRTFILLPTGD